MPSYLLHIELSLIEMILFRMMWADGSFMTAGFLFICGFVHLVIVAKSLIYELTGWPSQASEADDQ